MEIQPNISEQFSQQNIILRRASKLLNASLAVRIVYLFLVTAAILFQPQIFLLFNVRSESFVMLIPPGSIAVIILDSILHIIFLVLLKQSSLNISWIVSLVWALWMGAIHPMFSGIASTVGNMLYARVGADHLISFTIINTTFTWLSFIANISGILFLIGAVMIWCVKKKSPSINDDLK